MRRMLSKLAATMALGVPDVVHAQGISPQASTEELSGWRYFPGGPAWNAYMPYPFWAEAVPPPPQYYSPRPRACWRINRWGQVRPRRWC
jgi:hypothetical protein